MSHPDKKDKLHDTRKPWTITSYFISSEQETMHSKPGDVAYYKGYLIAESVDPRVAPIITGLYNSLLPSVELMLLALYESPLWADVKPYVQETLKHVKEIRALDAHWRGFKFAEKRKGPDGEEPAGRRILL